MWNKALYLAEKVLTKQIPDPTHGALFYHADYVMPDWASEKRLIITIGHHLFYNERLQKFCSNQEHIKFVNLATQLAQDTSVFYDDCHFNESGARKVAGIISEQIIR